MATEIFTNAALTKLAAAFSSTDTSMVLTDAGNFPEPGASEEFKVILIGAVSSTIEIVKCTTRSNNTLTISERGLEGTTAANFVAGDIVVHTITAASLQTITSSFAFYLGAQASDPTLNTAGEALVAGNFYFNTGTNQMRQYNGSSWQNFGIPNAAFGQEYVWYDGVSAYPAATPLPTTDNNGNVLPTFDEDYHKVVLFLDRDKQHEELGGSDFAEDFSVTYGTQNIVPVAEIPAGTVVTALVSTPGSLGVMDKYTQAQVDAIQAALIASIATKADASHTHLEAEVTDLDKYTQAQVDSIVSGLQTQINALVSFPEAPNDSDYYGRSGEAWEKLPMRTPSQPLFGGKAENLLVRSNGTGSIIASANAMHVRSTSGNEHIITGVSETITVTASGDNGLDTGSLATDTNYYVWIAYDPTGDDVVGVISLSASAPTVGVAYTHLACVGFCRTDSTSTIREFWQVGNEFIWSDAENFTTPYTIGSAAWVEITEIPTYIPTVNVASVMMGTLNSNRWGLSIDGSIPHAGIDQDISSSDVTAPEHLVNKKTFCPINTSYTLYMMHDNNSGGGQTTQTLRVQGFRWNWQ